MDERKISDDCTLNEPGAGLVEGAAASAKPQVSPPAPGQPEDSHPDGQLVQRVETIFAGLRKRLLSPPSPPWVLFMTWRDLLFASWRVPVEKLRPLVPPELELDAFDGSAWVSMVPMRVTDMHYRGVPPIPGMETLRELNLRTYVTRGNKPGVYFLSIDCPAVVSDWMANHFFGVPYLRANIATINDGGTYQYASERIQKTQPPPAFFGSFQPVGEEFDPSQNPLAKFLVERYCLYFVKDGVVWRGDIYHADWHLRAAEAVIAVNTIPKAAGLEVPAKPDHLVYCLETDTLIWLPVHDHLVSAVNP